MEQSLGDVADRIEAIEQLAFGVHDRRLRLVEGHDGSMSPAFVASRHMTWTCSGGVGFTKSAVVSWDHMGAWFAQLVTCAASSSCSRRTGSGEAAATLYGAAVPDAGNSSPLYGADLAKMQRVRTVISRELGHHALSA